MELRSGLEGLKSMLGISLPEPTAASRAAAGQAAAPGGAGTDHATVSSAGTEVAQTAADPGVRPEKVAAIQAAIAAGTYHVPSSAVAAKVIDSMLKGE